MIWRGLGINIIREPKGSFLHTDGVGKGGYRKAIVVIIETRRIIAKIKLACLCTNDRSMKANRKNYKI